MEADVAIVLADGTYWDCRCETVSAGVVAELRAVLLSDPSRFGE